jgi:hypothetical protein
MWKFDSNITNWLLYLLPRLIPISLAIVGWYLARWTGAAFGFFVGCLLAVVAWATAFYHLRKAQRMKRKTEISVLSDEQLKKFAVDPTSRDFGYAITELDRRGITVRPSVETLLELLTSSNPNRRAIGYSNLGIMYPIVFEKLAGQGSSSSDSPEVWQQRIAVFKAAN